MKDAGFDPETEVFRIELRPGRSLSRDAIAKFVVAFGEKREHTYRIRWDITPAGAARLASEAQPFRAALLGGGEVEFAPKRERAAVLVFWASWCKPCIDEAPHLERLYKQHGDAVEFLSVSIDEAGQIEELRRIVAGLEISYPVALDPGGEKILPKYADGIGIPLTFVIASDGKIRYTQRNYQAGDEDKLARAIADLLQSR